MRPKGESIVRAAFRLTFADPDDSDVVIDTPDQSAAYGPRPGGAARVPHPGLPS
jgi:hypothetical protein